MCHTSGVVFLDNIDVSCNMKRALDKMGVHYEMEGYTMWVCYDKFCRAIDFFLPATHHHDIKKYHLLS